MGRKYVTTNMTRSAAEIIADQQSYIHELQDDVDQYQRHLTVVIAEKQDLEKALALKDQIIQELQDQIINREIEESKGSALDQAQQIMELENEIATKHALLVESNREHDKRNEWIGEFSVRLARWMERLAASPHVYLGYAGEKLLEQILQLEEGWTAADGRYPWEEER